MRKEQPVLVLVVLGILAAPLAVAAWCDGGCSLDGQTTLSHLFYALMVIFACIIALKIYILVLTIQGANERAEKRRKSGHQ